MGYIILESYPIFQYYSSSISHKIDTGIFYWNKHGVILKNTGNVPAQSGVSSSMAMAMAGAFCSHRWQGQLQATSTTKVLVLYYSIYIL